MLAGERQDAVEIDELVRELVEGFTPPDKLMIIQRTETYFGPKLHLIDDAGDEYLLTAPGPDMDLCLWGSVTNDDGFKEYWEKRAEVRASLSEDQEGYHICPYCSKPLKTAEHERLAALGRCPEG